MALYYAPLVLRFRLSLCLRHAAAVHMLSRRRREFTPMPMLSRDHYAQCLYIAFIRLESRRSLIRAPTSAWGVALAMERRRARERSCSCRPAASRHIARHGYHPPPCAISAV